MSRSTGRCRSTASDLEVASISSCVPEVAIRRFCFAKLSRPETRLRPWDKIQVHRHMATLANHHKERGQFAYA